MRPLPRRLSRLGRRHGVAHDFECDSAVLRVVFGGFSRPALVLAAKKTELCIRRRAAVARRGYIHRGFPAVLFATTPVELLLWSFVRLEGMQTSDFLATEAAKLGCGGREGPIGVLFLVFAPCETQKI